MKTGYRIALAQMKVDPEPEENLVRCRQWLANAAKNRVDLLVFPEGQFGPYFPQYANQDASRYLMTLEAPILKDFRKACAEYHIHATANIYLDEVSGRYSATVFIGDHGEILGINRKMHITNVPQYHEQDYFDAGQDGFPVYRTGLGNIGVVICYDRHYPESLRACAMQDAHLVLIPTANTRDENMEMFEWEMRVSAFQNGLFIAMCNRVGQEDGMSFAGESLLTDPDGNLLAKGGSGEELLVGDINQDLVKKSRLARPYLKLRNPKLAKFISGMS
jgi:predicted amidohydrolase